MPSRRGGSRPPARRTITDLRVLAALSHPARVRLLNHLLEVGPSTATQCAPVAGASPSACSYHLRHLERFGLVERVDDDEPSDGRTRPWRAVATGYSILPTPSAHDAVTKTAMARLLRETIDVHAELAHDFLARAAELPGEWQDAAEFSSYGLLVDAGELDALIARIDAVVRPYLAATRADVPHEAEVVHVTLQAFPRPDVR
jgi:hypothetical protein